MPQKMYLDSPLITTSVTAYHGSHNIVSSLDKMLEHLPTFSEEL